MNLRQRIIDKFGTLMAFSKAMNSKTPMHTFRSVQNWVNNPDSIKLGTAKKIARLLDCSICDITDTYERHGED